MSNRTKLGLNILEAALLLGILGDALLRATPWGLNVLLFTVALVAAMAALQVRWGRVGGWRGEGGWLYVPVAFFAAAFAWRDSATLQSLDLLALGAAFALLAWRARGRSVRLAGLGDYALAMGQAALNALFASLPLLVTDVQWQAIPRGGVMRHVWAVARGLVIAVPLLFLFGALFMAADAVFEGIMLRTFQVDAARIFSHASVLLLCAWLAGGFLRGMLLTGEAVSVSLDAVPVIYTSITVDDERTPLATHSATAETTQANESGARRQPQSVVDDATLLGDSHETTARGDDEQRSNEQRSNEQRSNEQRSNERASNEQSSEARSSGADDARPNTSGKTRPNISDDARQRIESDEQGSAQAGAATTTVAAGGFTLGAVEVGVVLGLLDVLFACFVVVQFRYFFGGAARVLSITSLTYAEYARHGFFELAWVAALVLPLLLITHALLRRSQPVALKLFRLLAGAQVALLFVIMASAVGRMRLYQSEYGLTELRLYTTAFMFWLGLVFLWFAWTVLVRGARERFACGALVAAFVVTGLLHLLNPDAFIVRANVAHARAGRAFDAEYAARLSADAAPALVSALPALSREERCLLARELPARWESAASGEDWRSWNISRALARHAVNAHAQELRAGRETCPPPVASVPAVADSSAAQGTSAPTSDAATHDVPTNVTSNPNAPNVSTTAGSNDVVPPAPPAPKDAATMPMQKSAPAQSAKPGVATQSAQGSPNGGSHRTTGTHMTAARLRPRGKMH